MENSIAKAYSEVDAILSQMESKYVDKIPIEIRKIFKDEKDTEYHPLIEISEKILEQKLQRKTIAILAFLDLNYWCEDEIEKQKLINKFLENDRLNEQEKLKKYNPDNLFIKKENINNSENMSLQVQEKKGNIFSKLISFIKKFIHTQKIVKTK